MRVYFIEIFRKDQLLISNERSQIQPGHVYGGQNGNNLPTQRSQRGSKTKVEIVQKFYSFV